VMMNVRGGILEKEADPDRKRKINFAIFTFHRRVVSKGINVTFNTLSHQLVPSPAEFVIFI